MRMIAAPLVRLSSRIRSRICAWMVTSSAVVGLVGDQQLGIAGERDGDHDALAHAAGELVRIVVDAFVRRRNAGALQQRDRLLARRALREAAMAHQHLDDLLADRVDGLSEVIGSWKIIAMRSPRRSRTGRSPRSRSGRPSNVTLPEISASLSATIASLPMMSRSCRCRFRRRCRASDARDRQRHAVDRDRAAPAIAVKVTRRSSIASSGGDITCSRRRAPPQCRPRAARDL